LPASPSQLKKGDPMKRTFYAVAVLLLTVAATPLFAVQKNLVDDVIRMSKAGVAEDSIVEFVQKTDGRFECTADDVIAMSEAGVPKSVIHAVVNEAKARENGQRADGDRVVERSTVVVSPGYGYGYYRPYYYDPFYDPFWYQPRLSLSFGFGRGYYGGGHYGGGGHRGGGGGHGRH
jgi:uncharacterized membrane protein YgcG